MKRYLSLLLAISIVFSCIFFMPQKSSAATADVRGFVTRVYQVVLDRNPDADGLNYWSNSLTSHSKTAADVVANFFFSQEYKAKNKDNTAYVNDLYRCLMGRNADTDGRNYWLNKIRMGVPRINILAEFVLSTEFTRICSNYGVTRGTINTQYSTSRYTGIYNYLDRMYSKIFGRNVDSAGINYFQSRILSGQMNGCQVAYHLIQSAECTRRTPDNRSYLNMLFDAIRDYTPSESTMNKWLTRMNIAQTREQVFAQFANNSDYLAVCNRYGIARGSYDAGRIVDPDRPMIALTFDDGPATGTDRILDVLQQYRQTATFFVVGTNASRYQSTIARMARLGCEVGNHTNSHPDLTRGSEAAMISEIDTCNNYIRMATGHNATVIRPPYGSYNAVLQRVAGMPIILWSVDTRDWATRSTASTVSSILNNARDGAIILMHDIHPSTVEAACQVIPQLVAMGYQLVTVSEMAMYRGGMAPGQVYRSIPK